MSQRYQHRRLNRGQIKKKSSNVLSPPPNRYKSRRKRRSGRFFWLKKPLRLIYLKFLRLRGQPQVIAKGLAIGVFAGSFPLFGLQSLLGVILATIFKGSRVAAIAATWISNPLTYVPIFIFNYKIGKILLGTQDTLLPPLDLESFTAFKELGAAFAITLLTGSFVVGVILAVITYFYSLAILERWQAKRLKKKKK